MIVRTSIGWIAVVIAQNDHGIISGGLVCRTRATPGSRKAAVRVVRACGALVRPGGRRGNRPRSILKTRFMLIFFLMFRTKPSLDAYKWANERAANVDRYAGSRWFSSIAPESGGHVTARRSSVACLLKLREIEGFVASKLRRAERDRPCVRPRFNAEPKINLRYSCRSGSVVAVDPDEGAHQRRACSSGSDNRIRRRADIACGLMSYHCNTVSASIHIVSTSPTLETKVIIVSFLKQHDDDAQASSAAP